MKLIRTTGRGARAAAETLAALERRGGAALDAVLPAVKRIVADVRKRGDRALLRYAAEFDGLAGPDALRVTQRRDGGGVEGARSCAARRAVDGRRADSRVCQAADAEVVECVAGEGPDDRPACASARFGRLLCAQRPASAALHAADDGDSRAGGGRGAHRCGLAQARAGDACRGAPAGHHGVLSAGRRARRGRAGLRNRERCRAWTRSWARAIST